MDAEYTNQQTCTCELCQPNWHLGERGDFEVEPGTDLAKEHSAKLKRAGCKPDFVPLPTMALN